MKRGIKPLVILSLSILILFSFTVLSCQAEASQITVYKNHTYDNLTWEQKKICSRIMNDVKTSKKSTVTRTFECTEKDLTAVWNTINDKYFRYYGEISMTARRIYNLETGITAGMKVTVNIKTSRSRFERSEANRKKIKNIAASLTRNRVKPKAILLAINRYVCNYLTYSADEGTLDAALRKRNAKCTGYTAMFMALCEMCNIPCCQVMGQAEGESHSWNRVKLGSTWYNIDPTWNDLTGNAYLLSEGRWSDHEKAFARIYILNISLCGYN